MRPDEVIQNERRATETMSETSEGTVTTVSGKSGFESREELRDIAALLGIGNPDELHQDRFRVDRRKLEQMLLGDSDVPKPADTFFHNSVSRGSDFETVKRETTRAVRITVHPTRSPRRCHRETRCEFSFSRCCCCCCCCYRCYRCGGAVFVREKPAVVKQCEKCARTLTRYGQPRRSIQRTSRVPETRSIPPRTIPDRFPGEILSRPSGERDRASRRPDARTSRGSPDTLGTLDSRASESTRHPDPTTSRAASSRSRFFSSFRAAPHLVAPPCYQRFLVARRDRARPPCRLSKAFAITFHGERQQIKKTAGEPVIDRPIDRNPSLLHDDSPKDRYRSRYHLSTTMTVVMEETNTFVTWPSRLKIGAKSKKDPHIKVAGRPDDVRAAKEKIMEILDTRQSNRVTMKLDVSYTDHSHIIGKGGLTIKRVMEETGCHIHFPDSNRSNHQEKSNQVSIAGEMEGVERARARVRNLTPLIFSFELPIMGSSQTVPDSTSPYVVKIQEKYNVQVMFRTRPKLHATLVVVKGCEWEVSRVKEATVLLIHYMCQNLASQIQVQMSMEISPQHHSIVLGKQSSNLKMIMQRTGTQIMFPDAGDPNIPSLKKSNVTITGCIHNVYLARQQLVGSLPLVLMFDLPEDSTSCVDSENVSQLMQSLDVFINVRHKPKQSTLSVIIKGIERNASNIYEARKQLLGLDEPRVHAEIPATYHIPNADNVFQGNTSNGTGTNNLVGNLSDSLSNILTINTQNPPYCVSPMSHSPNPLGLSPHWGLSTIPSMFSPLPLHHSYPYPHLNHLLTTQHVIHNSAMPPHSHGLTNHALTGIGQLHPNASTGFHGVHGLNGSSLPDSKEGSAYSSLSSVSSSLSSPAISPRNVSPVNPTETSPNLDLCSMLSDLSVTDRRAPGCEKKSLEMAAQQNFGPFDYEQKKMLAAKAIQKKPSFNDYRVPTSAWSGYGLSQSIPPISTTDLNKESTTASHPSELWNEPKTPVFGKEVDFGIGSGIGSNYIEHTPTSHLNRITSRRYDDLTSMLTSVGLDKYIRLFTSHEVDMATFPSLTEKDLCEIGISAWGARRKIMLLIAEMNKRSSPFCGSAAPGAERKSSTVTIGSAPMEKCNLDTKW